jgi:dihydrofolate reductase
VRAAEHPVTVHDELTPVWRSRGVEVGLHCHLAATCQLSILQTVSPPTDEFAGARRYVSATEHRNGGRSRQGRIIMNRVIVIEFITLDGVVEDPDGSGGTPAGGWAFRFGPEAVAGDKFRLGPLLETGAILMGRRTWELFSKIWPGRTDDFSSKLNAAQKLVVSRTLTDVSAWNNSALINGDLIDEVRRHQGERDIIVIGSVGVAHRLMQEDLVDEYRLLVFPTVLGTGRHLFTTPLASEVRLTSATQSGAAALLYYERAV